MGTWGLLCQGETACRELAISTVCLRTQTYVWLLPPETASPAIVRKCRTLAEDHCASQLVGDGGMVVASFYHWILGWLAAG